MRVIYSTPRLENAERVSKLLEDRGIGVRLLYGPHHRRRNWRGADYRQVGNPGDWPRVMVLNNGDLPLAREALRELGLMAPAAFDRVKADQAPDSAPAFRTPKAGSGLATAPPIARRVRLALMVVVLILVAVQVGHYLLSAP
jgi:hypothetical protein